MKQRHKMIYSLDVLPITNNRWNMGDKLKETIYMTALSILYSHLWYDEIELYVDEIGFKFLYMLPCAVTKVQNDNRIELWMKSKINAMELQTKPFVHVDTDIFIKKKIDFSFDDVIVERKEDTYEVHYKKQVEFFNKYTNKLPYWHGSVYQNIVAARREIPSQSFGDSIEGLITHMDNYYKTNGMRVAFAATYGARLRVLAANYIFMHY